MKIRNSTVTLILLGALIATGCSSTTRPARERAYLLQRREEAKQKGAADGRKLLVAFLERRKAEYDAYTAGRRPNAPILDILIVSGGGDFGAFGAGVLKGWGRVPKSNPLARPKFEVVTGVSTGALIAPFAFLGDDDSIEQIVQLYREPKKDWVKKRGTLYFLPSHISLTEVPGLERDIKKCVSPEMVARLAAGSKEGKMLVVNTTCLDDASPRVFDLGVEAQRAQASGDLTRIHDIMLASSGIPGAFPYREIDGEMFVDGGVTSNILYGGRLTEENTLPAIWQELYPGVPIPKIRYWVIFNNQMQTAPIVVPARWIDIVSRSVELSTRSASLTAMRHLHAMSEISRLKRKADIEVRILAIPDSWVPPVPGVFMKETMNSLTDIGEKLGADPSSWNSNPGLQ